MEGWARDGLTEKDIAHNMGVAYSTFRLWLDKFPALLEALKKGKAPADIIVENALYKSATGYTTTVRKPIKIREKQQIQGKGTVERERVEYVEEEVYIQPNTTAQIFWLKNRRPDKWRDRVQTETVNADVEDLSPLVELLRDE